jgi:hypothetical protein
MRGHAAARKCVHVCTSARATQTIRFLVPDARACCGRDRTVSQAEGFCTEFAAAQAAHNSDTNRCEKYTTDDASLRMQQACVSRGASVSRIYTSGLANTVQSECTNPDSDRTWFRRTCYCRGQGRLCFAQPILP